MSTDGLPVVRRNIAQWVYENLPVSGHALWSRIINEGRVPDVPFGPAEGETALKILGDAVMDRLADSIFVFAFHDRSRLTVAEFKIEAEG